MVKCIGNSVGVRAYDDLNSKKFEVNGKFQWGIPMYLLSRLI